MGTVRLFCDEGDTNPPQVDLELEYEREHGDSRPVLCHYHRKSLGDVFEGSRVAAESVGCHDGGEADEFCGR